MEKRLEDIVRRINEIEKQFYKEMIPVHNDEKLRSFMKEYSQKSEGFIIKGNVNNYGNCLSYSSNGFKFGVSKFHDTSDYWGGSGYYTTRFQDFKVVKEKLIVPVSSKKNEMLQLFPNITIEDVYSKIEEGMKRNDVYRRDLK